MIPEDNKCIGLTGNLFGHKMEPRFSTTYEKCFTHMTEEAGETDKEKMELKTQTYEADICVRCGKIAI